MDNSENFIRCRYWDGGWCYHPVTDYGNGCIGYDKCSDKRCVSEVEDVKKEPK